MRYVECPKVPLNKLIGKDLTRSALLDESQPVCRRCQKRGLDCTGMRATTFIQGKIVASRRTEKHRNVTTSYGPEDNASVDLQLSPLTPLTGNDIELYICYFREHSMFRSGMIASAAQRLQPNEVIPAGGNTATLQLFPQAYVTFATVFFGVNHRQTHIINYGYTMCGAAIKQLNQALSEPKCYNDDNVIISVVALALLESWMPSGPKNYLHHMAGVERLLELRGPNPESLELHKGQRQMILFASLSTRKPSILARAEWKRAFRINCSENELQQQDLYDVLADCTVLAAERDNVLATRAFNIDGGPTWYKAAEKKTLDLLTHLYTWKKEWASGGENSYLEILATGDDPPPFLTTFEFSSDFTATIFLFYNSVLIHALRILISLPLDCKDEYITAEGSAALDICRCIPYYLLRKPHLDLRTVHLAVVTAWKTLRRRETAEGRWLMDILSTRSQEAFAKGLWAD